MADINKIKLPSGAEYNIKDYRIPGVDTTPTSGSDNVVTSGGVYNALSDSDFVISTALNDLNTRLSNVEEIDEVPTENSTNPVSSGGVYDVIVENEEITSAALNTFNDRLIEVEEGLSNINVEETDPVFTNSPAYNITSANITSWNNKVSNVQSDWNATSGNAVILNKPNLSDYLTVSQYRDDEIVIASAFNDLNDRINVVEDKEWVTSEPYSQIDSVVRDTYTKSEIDTMLSNIGGGGSGSGSGGSGEQAVTSVTVSGSGNAVTNATFSNKALTLTKGNIATPGTLTTTSTTALSTASNEALSGSINLHKIAKTGTYSDLIGKPTIPAAPGTLNTNNTTAQTASSSEALSGTINLHKVAKTGSYNDLLNKPTIPDTSNFVSKSGGTMNNSATLVFDNSTAEFWTEIGPNSIITQDYGNVNLAKTSGTGFEVTNALPFGEDYDYTKYGLSQIINNSGTTGAAVSNIITIPKKSGTIALTSDIPSAVIESTVSGWGFTKNSGTITGITMNGASKGTSGVVDLGTVITSHAKHKLTTTNGTATSASGTITYVESLTGTTTATDGDLTLTATRKSITIPSAPGTLNTTATTAQSTAASEALSGSITLHKVAKTGTYSDLIGTPTIPTVNNSTISIQKGGTAVDSFTTNASSAKTINIPNELPSYSSSDSGKVLSVNSSGQLVWITPAQIYSGSGTPSNGTGNNGDIYLQS